MAAYARLHFLLISCFITLQLFLLPTNASPGIASSLNTPHLIARKTVLTNVSGEIHVTDTNTRTEIPQGPATDGAGSGAISSPPTLIWVGFSFLLGLPLAVAGIRGWRITLGAGAGLAFAVCSWAAVINTVNEVGVPDLILIATVAGFFFLGFILGMFEFARIACLVLLALVGGSSVGIRIILVKEGLLFAGDNIYAANWVIIGILSAACVVGMIWRQRIAILGSCASIGTFLIALAVDLLLNQTRGLSRGLRFLFDRNTNHIADIQVNGYHPPIATQILIGASILLIPAFAYLQHRLFKAPFSRKPPPPSDEELGINFPTDPVSEKSQSRFFSTIWTGDSVGKLKANRFTLV